MEPFKTNTTKHSLYIIDDDYYYALRVKHSLNKKFGGEIRVDVFQNAESSVDAMRKSVNKPQVLLMDHLQNKKMLKENGEHTIDAIKKISPDTRIVILSNEKDKDNALKALGYGAQSFVLKDQFALDHIYSAVENCLHPSKV